MYVYTCMYLSLQENQMLVWEGRETIKNLDLYIFNLRHLNKIQRDVELDP